METEETEGRGYSIWIIPNLPIYNRALRIINRISLNCGTPKFEPHITLLGDILGDEGQAISATEDISQTADLAKLSFSRTGHSEKYFKSVYLEAKTTGGLLASNLLAKQLFKKDLKEEYNPHMSLIYAKLPESERERIASAVSMEEMSSEFGASRLSLYSTAGKVTEWFKISDFKIRPKSV